MSSSRAEVLVWLLIPDLSEEHTAFIVKGHGILSNSMEQNPYCETNSCSDSQEILHLLLNPEIHYRIHKRPPPLPILSQTSAAHTPSARFLKVIYASVFQVVYFPQVSPPKL